MATLAECVARVRAITSPDLAIEIVIVDDASTDDSLATAERLAERHPEVKVYSHALNQGKGAALRTASARSIAFSDTTRAVHPSRFSSFCTA